MDMKKEERITKAYAVIMMWLMIASALINIGMLFVPAFSVNMFFASAGEMGIEFLGMNLEKIGDSSSSLIEAYCFDSMFLIGETGWLMTIKIEVMIILCIALVSPVFSIVKKPQVNSIAPGNVKYSMYFSNIGASFFFNTVYALTTFLLCFIKLNDWHFEPITTYTYIPWILHLGVYIACKILHNHKKLAVKGEKSPIMAVDMIEAENKASHTASTASNVNKTQEKNNVVNENDRVELLIKYKELLDNGVIDDTEYQQKKQEILGGDK